MEKLIHFRHILLLEFNRWEKVAEAPRNTCALSGDNAIGESTARKWFYRSRKNRFVISYTPRSGRSTGFHEDRSNILIHNDLVSLLENWQI